MNDSLKRSATDNVGVGLHTKSKILRRITALIRIVVTLSFIFIGLIGYGQDIEALVKRVQAKLEQVSDYQAQGQLKTDVPFMKVPESSVSIYYKKPDKFKIRRAEGISIVPKGGVSINLNSLFSGNEYTVIPGGTSSIAGRTMTVVKLIPLKEDNDVVLSTLYIDEKEALIYKATTTTKSSGSYEMEMKYGRFSKWGLPDKVVFSFNTKDYKLPKGVTFEYETDDKPAAASKPKNQKGTIEITYQSYSINKGIQDAVFATSK